MKHAIVILAHKSPESVKILTELLSREFDVFLHWDGKYRIPKELYSVKKLKILTNRIACLWAEFSIWESMWVSLFYIDNLGEYQDVTFISANDFPLMKPKDMISLLESTNNSFIDFNDTYSGKILGDKIIPYGMILGVGKIPEAEELAERYLPKKYDEFDLGYKLSDYVGSQWCTIKLNIMYALVHYVNRRKEFIKALKSSLIVDEMAFQTMFKRLKLPYEGYHRKLAFNDCVAHPDKISEDEVIEILKSGQKDLMFGRKVEISEFNRLDEIRSLLEVN